MFRKQVTSIAGVFEQWNECEQTVALYSLLKRLSPVQARFLALALEHSLADCAQLHLHEQQANNPAFVGSLLAERQEAALEQLLVHLPLLRPGNSEARGRYLAAVHHVLGHCVESGRHVEAARQLLSYSLIHPAMGTEDRRALAKWLRHLEERIAHAGAAAAAALGVTSECTSQLPDTCHRWIHPMVHSCSSVPTINSKSHVSFSQDNHARVRRSNSLTPPVSVNHSSELWRSQDDLSVRHKTRSLSLSSDQALPPLSPQSSQASSGSGSESHLDEPRICMSHQYAGMRDVPAWLKSLRLHKYLSLFAQLTYDEMLNLNEEWLATQGVTKGARHKIILSIRKLRERHVTLCQLEKDVVAGGNLVSALDELKTILLSPIRPEERDETAGASLTDVNDIPTQFTKVMGKVCTQLLVCQQGGEEECIGTFIWLLDRCLQHEAFTPTLRRKLATWRVQIQHAWQPLPGSANLNLTKPHTRHTKWHLQPQVNGILLHPGVSPSRPQRFVPPPPPLPPQTATVTSSLLSSYSGYSPPRTIQEINQQHLTKQCSLQEGTESHMPLHRTISAPPKPPTITTTLPRADQTPSPAGDPDLNHRLESLCLSMTEHALSGAGDL